MELKSYLARNAARLGGCADGMAQLRRSRGKSGMVQCFWDRIDFCLANDFPDKECIKRDFPRAAREAGIYVDRCLSLRNERRTAFLGTCSVDFTADGYAVSRIYLKHDGVLRIRASEHAFVMIDALDDASVEAECSGDAQVIVNLYGRAAAEGTGEGLKVVHKNRATYEL